MSWNVVRRDTCRPCRSRSLEAMLSLGATPPGDHYVSKQELATTQESYPNDVMLCRDCGQVQLAHVVNPEILYGRYTYNTAISLGLVDHFRGLVDFILTQRSTRSDTGNLVVDIGSNDGSVLKIFKGRGLDVLGVDPATAVAQKASQEGIETLPTFFTPELARKITSDRGKAAIVCANNVMANLDDLESMVQGVSTLLADDGIFVFETGYVLDLIQKSVFDNIYHEHVSYFAVRPLATFFARNGLELVDVQRVDTKGGSIRGVVQKQGASRKPSSALAELAALEKSTGLDQPALFADLSRRLEKSRTDLQAFLKSEKAKGHRVAGFGASVGVTTMLYYYGIEASQLEFLADDNPVKIGTFSPGKHIPVMAGSAMAEREIDSTVVFAWRYIDPIARKHSKFLEMGGTFVIPLPEVTLRSK